MQEGDPPPQRDENVDPSSERLCRTAKDSRENEKHSSDPSTETHNDSRNVPAPSAVPRDSITSMERVRMTRSAPTDASAPQDSIPRKSRSQPSTAWVLFVSASDVQAMSLRNMHVSKTDVDYALLHTPHAATC